MPKPGTGQELVVFQSGFLAECFLQLLLLCTVFPVCLWSFGGGSKKPIVHWFMSEGPREAIFVLRTGRDSFFCRGPGTGIKYEKRVNGTWNSVRNFPAGENGPTFLDFQLFLGIFQWDEPKKRFPLTAEPKFPEIFTKWKAIGSPEPVVSLVRYKLGRVVLGRGDENDSQSHRRSEARERNTCYGASKLWWHRWTKACSKSSWQTKNETALI